MKRALSIGLRLLGIALVAFILFRIQYGDRLTRADGTVVPGKVVDDSEGARFVADGTGEVTSLPENWKDGLEAGTKVTLGLFSIVLGSKKLLLAFGVFIFGPITFISITRWWGLLRSVGIPITYREAFRLTFIGFFFNSAVPGLTGGDLVKAFYIARQTPSARILAFMSVLVDRVIGLFALGLLSGLILLPHLGDETFRPPAMIVFIFLGISAAFGAVFLSGRLRRLVHLDTLIRKLPMSKTLVEIDQGIVIYRKHPKAVVLAILLSLLNHFSLVVMAIIMGRALGIEIPATQFFILVPVCMMMASIPLLPGGWGLREGAFATFFGLVGVPVTEAVALSILIGLTQLLWSLLGGVFFLLRPDRATSRDLADFSHEVEEQVEGGPEASATPQKS